MIILRENNNTQHKDEPKDPNIHLFLILVACVSWRGVAGCGVVWRGLLGRELCGLAWIIVRHGVGWLDVVWRDLVWRGVVWRGLLRRGVVWRGIPRQGVLWRDVAWHGVEAGT